MIEVAVIALLITSERLKSHFNDCMGLSLSTLEARHHRELL